MAWSLTVLFMALFHSSKTALHLGDILSATQLNILFIQFFVPHASDTPQTVFLVVLNILESNHIFLVALALFSISAILPDNLTYLLVPHKNGLRASNSQANSGIFSRACIQYVLRSFAKSSLLPNNVSHHNLKNQGRLYSVANI